MKFQYCLLAVLCPLLSIAQGARIHPLSIGDTVPDITITNITNYTAPAAKLGDFKGMTIILDFMATTCSGCVEALARMDSLQKEFSGRIQILPVTYENAERVGHFLQNNWIGKRVRLPFITSDTLLDKFFPHQSISHIVWIDGTSVVRAITISQYVKEENILAILDKEAIRWPVKMDEAGMDTGNVPNNTNIYRAAFSGYRPERQMTAREAVDTVKGTRDFFWSNLKIIDLYKQVYRCIGLPASHILLKVKSRARFVYDPSVNYIDVFDAQNRFSYEASLPLQWTAQKTQQKIVNDLNNYLSLDGTLGKKKLPCMVIIKKNGVKTPKDSLRRTTLANLIWDLNNAYTSKPVLDETNLPGKTTLYISNPADMARTRLELQAQGFDMITAERVVKCLSIRECPAF